MLGSLFGLKVASQRRNHHDYQVMPRLDAFVPDQVQRSQGVGLGDDGRPLDGVIHAGDVVLTCGSG